MIDRDEPTSETTDGPVPEMAADAATVPPAAAAPTDPATEPLGLTEAALEALLFVAERPLGRREIATLAGVDRDTVDARVGDLEIRPRGRAGSGW